MANVNEQLKQVEWNDPGVQNAPPPRSTSSWLRWVVVATVGVVLVVVAVFAVRALIDRDTNGRETEQEMAAAVFDCQDARDAEKCMSNVPARLAKDTGDATYCRDLEGDAYDSCVSGAAKTALDARMCRDIKDDDRRTSCEQAVHALTKDGNDTIEYCAGFTDPRVRGDCEHDWIRDRILAGECSHQEITDELCNIGTQYAAAIVAKNPDLCYQIADADYRDECYVFTSPGDRDFDNLVETLEAQLGTSDTDTDSDDDGLMDGEEVNVYGTDPANPDSDGDGFDDGTEVGNGFDPLT